MKTIRYFIWQTRDGTYLVLYDVIYYRHIWGMLTSNWDENQIWQHESFTNYQLEHHEFPLPWLLIFLSFFSLSLFFFYSCLYKVGVIKAVRTSLDSSEEVTALWVTHRLEELKYADGAVYMENGEVVMQGDAAKILEFIRTRQSAYIKQINSWRKCSFVFQIFFTLLHFFSKSKLLLLMEISQNGEDKSKLV